MQQGFYPDALFQICRVFFLTGHAIHFRARLVGCTQSGIAPGNGACLCATKAHAAPSNYHVQFLSIYARDVIELGSLQP